MPVYHRKDKHGYYYQYNNLQKYYYSHGDEKSRTEAKSKANKQAAAVSISKRYAF
jgi:hypothetical protein